MKFSEMPYARPDTETVKKQLTELTERLKNAGTYEEAKAAFLEEQKASLAVETQATLASIRHSIDTRDTFYDEEEKFWNTFSPELEEYQQAWKAAMLESKFRPEFTAEYGDLMFVNAEIARKCFTPEIIPEMQQENDLVQAYEKLLASAQIPFEGKTYTLSQLTPLKSDPDDARRLAAWQADAKWSMEHAAELDAALCWHPDENTGVRVQTSLANCQVLYKFNGKAAHAGAEPHLGRSALDAVELMDIGANYLREHMIDQARVHYAITDAGGFSPNVVQPHAEVLYLIRAPRSAQVKELYERVNDIARGAALMTGTTVEIDFVKACSDTILNDTLQRVLYEKMAQIGVPEITEADEAFARELTETALIEYPKADPVHPIHDELLPYTGQIEYECGSTDVGDVSWVCPTVQAKAATWAFGTPCHSWQAVTQGVMPLAHKMTLYIAKSLAAMGAELMVNAELLERAKQEHRRLVGPEGYVCPIPKGVKPRSMDSLHK